MAAVYLLLLVGVYVLDVVAPEFHQLVADLQVLPSVLGLDLYHHAVQQERTLAGLVDRFPEAAVEAHRGLIDVEREQLEFGAYWE